MNAVSMQLQYTTTALDSPPAFSTEIASEFDGE